MDDTLAKALLDSIILKDEDVEFIKINSVAESEMYLESDTVHSLRFKHRIRDCEFMNKDFYPTRNQCWAFSK